MAVAPRLRRDIVGLAERIVDALPSEDDATALDVGVEACETEKVLRLCLRACVERLRDYRSLINDAAAHRRRWERKP